jgi:hypothetical protein
VTHFSRQAKLLDSCTMLNVIACTVGRLDFGSRSIIAAPLS